MVITNYNIYVYRGVSASAVFCRRQRGELQRVDLLRQSPRRAAHRPALALEAAFAGEGVGDDLDTEMGFAAGPCPGMAGMAVRIIDDGETRGCRLVSSFARMRSATVMASK